MFVVHYAVSDGQSLKDVCAEIEAQQSWEDEQFMEELDSQLGIDERIGDDEEEQVALYAQEEARWHREMERDVDDAIGRNRFDSQLSTDELEEVAWNAYQFDLSPSETERAWLYEDDDPFAVI